MLLADRMKLQLEAEKKKAEGKTDEKKAITLEEYDDAVDTALNVLLEEDEIHGILKMMIGLSGAVVAGMVREILFGKEEDE